MVTDCPDFAAAPREGNLLDCRQRVTPVCQALTQQRDAGLPGRTGCRQLRAQSIGCQVRRTGETGRVEAIFERACNVVLESGRLLAVLGREAGNVAHGVRLECGRLFDHGLRTGMSVDIAFDRINFGREILTVDLSAACVWVPKLRAGMWSGNAHSQNALTQARNMLAECALRSGSDFLAVCLGFRSVQTPLSDKIGHILPQLIIASRAHNSNATLGLLAELIGLGPGLTPAGDDFIIGWLAGLALTAHTPSRVAFLQAVRAGVETLARRTTFVSAQHLRDACGLLFSERLSDLGVAIALGEPEIALAAHVAAQVAVGASSGADAAAGLMFGLSECVQAY